MGRASGQRGAGDRILESRHLVGLFFGVVLLCGVFFTLGYVMGKTQYGGDVHAATGERPAPLNPRAAQPKDVAAAPAASVPGAGEWDFYSKKDDNHLEPASPTDAAAPTAKKISPARLKAKPSPARYVAPKMARGAMILQVAALRHQGDALAVADALQRKGFPSFVIAPTTDRFYRVQVGPFADERRADSAREALDRAGFKAILKR